MDVDILSTGKKNFQTLWNLDIENEFDFCKLVLQYT